ncbi:hypothetical protein CBR_g23225 [Chara braunii]|uniref:Uncharacterized protein n=1 Tax=Chara braunii TaxID=69332 RepID=A0A388JV60_CHABU|nr:hypothetical protein CBR_g23225 [Chara braunii]|eukprot:GBG61709.1 hypothetical protein CBR_g23225 [Chara braunii]
MTGSALGMPGQLANESIVEYRQRFEAQLALIEAEEQRQAAAEAARLQAEATTTVEKQRLQAKAEVDTQARRKEAQDLLQRHEATSIEQLKFWPFKPSEEHDDATPEEQHRVDHVVAMLGDISTFAAPATISKQLDTLKTEVHQLHQLPNKDGNSPQHYKMPTFQIEKFDDYTHQDPVLWWEGFATQIRILFVPNYSYIGALFLNSKGGCQIWLSHLATVHGVDVADLKDKISRQELTRLWKKRFIVDDAPALAINRLFAMTQGNTATQQHATGSRNGKRSRQRRISNCHFRICAGSSTTVPTPLTDVGVEVVDLYDYIAKIDREFKTQRWKWSEHGLQANFVMKTRFRT